MAKNYTQRLDKLQKRRTDETIQKAFLTESFRSPQIGESTKYALESMMEIEPSYTQNTFLAAEKIQANLTKGLALKNIGVEYRYQGSVATNTHIKIHSDIDILVIIEKFYNLEHPLVPPVKYTGDINDDMSELRNACEEILEATYNQVDISGVKSIKVFPTQPKRKVDVVPASWLDTVDYDRTKLEMYRGIKLFDKKAKTHHSDYTFLNMARIKEKDNAVNGNVRKLIRLLKTLKVDADYLIDLTSFELSSIVYNIDSSELRIPTSSELLLLPIVSKKLGDLIELPGYRVSMLSPNGREKVFEKKESAKVELQKMKREVDELIEDISNELYRQQKNINQPFIYK